MSSSVRGKCKTKPCRHFTLSHINHTLCNLLYTSLHFPVHCTTLLCISHFACDSLPSPPSLPKTFILPGWEFQRPRLSNPTPRELLVGFSCRVFGGCGRLKLPPSLPLILTSLALLSSPEPHCSRLNLSFISFLSIIFFSSVLSQNRRSYTGGLSVVSFLRCRHHLRV